MEAGELIAELRAFGWIVSAPQFDAGSFGNWFVDLQRGSRTLRLVKDRSQFMLAGATHASDKGRLAFGEHSTRSRSSA